MQLGSEFILHASDKFNHSSICLDAYAPIINYIIENNIDLDVKIYINNKHRHKAYDLGIPDKYLVGNEFYDSNNKYVFANYGIGNSYCYENFFKLMYGHGDENFVYNQSMVSRISNYRGIICYSDYDCYKFSFNGVFRKYRLLSIGATKFSSSTRGDLIKENLINKLISQGYDPSKKTIVYQHTRDKSNDKNSHVDVSGYIGSSSLLRDKLYSLSSEYNIINKSHSYEDEESQINIDNFINISAGEYTNKLIYELSDLTISDYGGSSLESLFSSGNLLFINNTEDYLSNYELTQNLDILIHEDFNSVTEKEFIDLDLNSLSLPNDTILNKYKRLLFGKDYSEKSNERFVNFLISLSNGDKLSEYDYNGNLDYEDYSTASYLNLLGKQHRKSKRFSN